MPPQIKYLAIAMLLLLSCSTKQDNREQLIKEYNTYLEIKSKSDSLNHSDGSSAVVDFLNSLIEESTESYISSYVEILKVYYLNDDRSKLKSLDELQAGEIFQNGSPHMRYLILYPYKSIYKRKKEYVNSLNQVLTYIPYLEEYEDIYFQELVTAYIDAAFYSAHFLHESEKSKEFDDLSLQLALKYKSREAAEKVGYNMYVEYHSTNDALKDKMYDLKFNEFKEDSIQIVRSEIERKSIEMLQIALNIKGMESDEDKFTRYAYLMDVQIRHAYSNLSEFDNIKKLDSEVEKYYNEGFYNEYQYAGYLLEAVEDDIDNQIMDGALDKLYYLEKYYKSTEDDYYLFNMYRAWYKYYRNLGLEKEQLEKISSSFFHFKKHVNKTNNIDSYEQASMSRLWKRAEQIIQKDESLSKSLKYSLLQEYKYLDWMKYQQFSEESIAYKDQLNYLTNKDIQYAENEAEYQKAKSKTYSILLALSLISLTIFSILAVLLIKKNRIIRAQNREIELITNSVPIGLCKMDRKYNLVWDNNAFKDFFKVSNNSYKSNEDIRLWIIDTFKESLYAFDKKEGIYYELGITDDFKIRNSFSEGLKWLKFVLIPVKKKNKTEEFILLIDDHTKVKQDEVLLLNQKNKIEANLKNNLLVLANNFKMIEEVKDIVKANAVLDNDLKKELLRSLTNKNNEAIIENIDFEFQKAEEEFYNRLTKIAPQLTSRNLKLCSYIRLGLSVKEIASLFFVTPASLKMARSRLRKKLDVPADIKFEAFLNSI